MSRHSSHNPYAVVLDTNVVLDWLVFRNPVCSGIETALDRQWACWIATPAMFDEMAHVLQRGLGARWAVDETAWRAAWSRRVHWVPAPAPSPALPRCSDPDDQKFIELAIGAPAHWLLTRDRALLKLGRRARAYGVEVLTPERWNATAGAALDTPAVASSASIS